MVKKLKIALATSALVIGGLAGFATAERATTKPTFEAMKAKRKAMMLAKFDANNNGALDASERKTMKDTRAAKRFDKLDTNNDGVLSLEEFKAQRGMHRHRGLVKKL